MLDVGMVFIIVSFISFAVIRLQFGQQNYIFSEDTQTNDISIVISNYDELVIDHDVSVTLVGFSHDSNATHDGMNNNTVMYIYNTCINMYPHAGCFM